MRAAPLVALGVIGGSLATWVAPVAAGEANAASDSSGITAGAVDAGSGPTASGGGSTGGGAVTMCTPAGGQPGALNWRRVPDDLLTTEQQQQAAAEQGGWYWKYCGDQPDVKVVGTSNGAVWFPAGGGAPVDARALASEALERTPLPAPGIRMSPQPPVPLLVGLPTYLWVDPAGWGARTASATAGGITSTVTAMPDLVVWDMGEGDVVECRGPGRPPGPSAVDPGGAGACTFTYPFSSARSGDGNFTVTATVRWQATWTASGAAGGGSLGTVERSATTTVRVAEIQALNANPRASS